MEAEKASHSVARMAGLLAVSRSGYYAWTKQEQAGPSPAQQRRAQLITKITKFHHESDQVYGSPRILADLRDDGEQVSRKTVAKLMRSNGIVGISPRGWTPTTTVPDLAAATIPDLVGRRFDHGQLNRVWTSDITYLATDQGWLYLCAVRDGCSRRVLGWSVQDHLRADLVDQALTMAVVLRGTLPERSFPRGSPDPAHLRPDRRTVRRSRPAAVGRWTGVCWDNAPAESFWSTLKTEFYNRHWPTKAAARPPSAAGSKSATTGNDATPPSA